MQKMNRYYNNKIFIILIQTFSIILIAFSGIAIILKAMLVFGYVMLFRQERWHKHLLIMFIMLCIMSVSSSGLSSHLKVY
jgi:hypothetical protein